MPVCRLVCECGRGGGSGAGETQRTRATAAKSWEEFSIHACRELAWRSPGGVFGVLELNSLRGKQAGEGELAQGGGVLLFFPASD